MSKDVRLLVGILPALLIGSLLIDFGGATPTFTATRQKQDKPIAQAKRQTLDEKLAHLPVTDFYTPEEPLEPYKKQQRQTRNARHNSAVSADGTKRPILNEEMEAVLLDLPLSHHQEEPAIPVSQSDAVVIGTITNLKAFLSDDRTSVYSEMTVNVEEVLKQDPRYPLVKGLTLDAERSGGGVRFPSGKILRRGALGRNIPEIGARYVLFLIYNEQGKDFCVLTGYQLTGDRVLPLDGTWDLEKGGRFSQFAGYEKYVRAPVSTFLVDVRQAIAAQNGLTHGGGG